MYKFLGVWIKFTLVILFMLFIAVFIIPKSGLEENAEYLPNFLKIVLIPYIIYSIIYPIYLKFLRDSYEYSLTKNTVKLKGGIFKKINKEIPYSQITHIVVSQDVFQKVLGISTLDIQTAGMASELAEMQFEGLKNSKEVKEYLNLYNSKRK